MVMTVEPGVYVVPGSKGVARKWWDIGIRIEDDVLVTRDGCEVLTGDVPKTVDAIEALMADGNQRAADSGKRAADSGKRTADSGKRTAVSGQRAAGREQRAGSREQGAESRE